jgi:hypothetical protein
VDTLILACVIAALLRYLRSRRARSAVVVTSMLSRNCRGRMIVNEGNS